MADESRIVAVLRYVARPWKLFMLGLETAFGIAVQTTAMPVVGRFYEQRPAIRSFISWVADSKAAWWLLLATGVVLFLWAIWDTRRLYRSLGDVTYRNLLWEVQQHKIDTRRVKIDGPFCHVDHRRLMYNGTGTSGRAPRSSDIIGTRHRHPNDGGATEGWLFCPREKCGLKSYVEIMDPDNDYILFQTALQAVENEAEARIQSFVWRLKRRVQNFSLI